ncbi:MAG: Gfo/Idh/MocA family oxidoreductase [Clostridia bacterium]|nr:Gfo/Idh/MocA family oxidoreductase [Clostridia bacterium]
MKEIKVGIIGTGGIAANFAKACAMTVGITAVGVSSRSVENGRKFADANGLEIVYDGAQALVDDPQIDLVYVAIPHSVHYEHCLMALRAGKHVLCEKPMCLNRRDAEHLFAEAKARGLLLMEGMWSRFLPNNILAKQWIDDGEIGDVRFIDGSFSFRVDPEHPIPRLVEYEQAGGAVFDLGVYTVEMASWFAGADPIAWTGSCVPWTDGVDGASVFTLQYPGNLLATVRQGLYCDAPADMTIFGTKGRIELSRFFSGRGARLIVDEKVVKESDIDCELPKGFTWEAAAVRDYIRNGVTESPVVSKETTCNTAEILGDMMHRFFPDHYGPAK